MHQKIELTVVDPLISSPKALETFNISYSMLDLFRNCRKAAQYRYVEGLYPKGFTQRKLDQGSLFHSCLEKWYTTFNRERVFEVVDEYMNKSEANKDVGFHTKAMMEGYIQQYKNDHQLEIVTLEQEFTFPIHDITTGKKIPNVQMYGRVDGIVKYKDEYYLLENKTAASLTTSYIEKLWTDLQIQLYTYYASQALGFKCAGVFYNVMVKSKLFKDEGETLDEYTARKRAAELKNKSGKTNIARKMPEDDSDYYARLLKDYCKPEMFYRENLRIHTNQIKETIGEVGELVKAFISCYQREKFYRNTGYCFKYNTPCQFYSICRSHDNESVKDSFYTKKPRSALGLLNQVDVGDEIF